jgi:hypothetical protein
MRSTRNWFWAVAVLGAAAWGFSGCATARQPSTDVETVGQLTPSYASIRPVSAGPTADNEVTFKPRAKSGADKDADISDVDLPEVVRKEAHGF